MAVIVVEIFYSIQGESYGQGSHAFSYGLRGGI